MLPWRALTALLVAASALLAPRLAPAQHRGSSPVEGGRLLPGSDLWFAALFQLTNPVEGGQLQFRRREVGFRQGSVSFVLTPRAAFITFSRADSARRTLPTGGRWPVRLPLTFNESGFLSGIAWDVPSNLPAGRLRSRESGLLVVVGGRAPGWGRVRR